MSVSFFNPNVIFIKHVSNTSFCIFYFFGTSGAGAGLISGDGIASGIFLSGCGVTSGADGGDTGTAGTGLISGFF